MLAQLPHWQRKKRCPKCGRRKIPNQFKRDDKKGWCRACRNFHVPKASPASYELVADSPASSSSSPLEAEVKLGQQRIIRVRVVGGMVVLTSGRIEERQVSEVFVECATITIPFRVLPEVRTTLARAARHHPKS